MAASFTETKRMVGLGDWGEVGMRSECTRVSNRKDEAVVGEDRSDGYIKVCDYLMSPNILMVINAMVHITVRGREGRPGGEGEAREGRAEEKHRERERKESDAKSKVDLGCLSSEFTLIPSQLREMWWKATAAALNLYRGDNLSSETSITFLFYNRNL